jgi:sialidase-1
MPTVWIPAPLRDVSGGTEQVTAEGTTVRELVDHLERQFPGIRERLCEGAELRSGMAVSIDGEIAPEGMRANVAEANEVHFVPAISGGRPRPTRTRAMTTVTACLLFTSIAIAAPPAGKPLQSSVFVAGTDGYHTYRIPAVIATPRGTLLAFCEGRKNNRSDHGDIDLVLKRSTDGGRTWSDMQIVYEEGGRKEVTIGNPCPVVDTNTGRVWLPFCRDNVDVLVTSSDDDGRTWAEPRNITEQVKRPGWQWYATGPGVGIQLQSGAHQGRLMIPCDHSDLAAGKRRMVSHVFYSDDHGNSWQLGASLPPHTDECQVAELADGTLMLNMRNYWGRDGGRPELGHKRAVATSNDGGSTWSELRFDETLIEPICQASLLRYDVPDASARGDRNVSRLLFSNPASTQSRSRMTVRLSTDDGQSWPIAKLLHEGPAAYSCLTVLPDGSIGCLYERGNQSAYETITFARFTLDWLTGGTP